MRKREVRRMMESRLAFRPNPTGGRNCQIRIIYFGGVRMEIPSNATVACTDGVFGRSKHVFINPVKRLISKIS